MIVFTCTVCQKKLSVQENVVGKKVKCPVCRQVTVVLSQPAGAEVSSQATVDATDEHTHAPPTKSEAAADGKSDCADDSNLTAFLAPPQVGDELGRLGEYRILKILGQGGMGVVFLGEDPKLNRKVAIKAMLPHLSQNQSAQERFLREARAAAALEHDHIVAIHHVGEDRGAPYIVMPLLKGEPLDGRLKRTARMPLTEVIRIGREIAMALAAAHATGLIHRDVKPANIWLEAPEDRVKILDFGLARAATEERVLTQQGAIVGTPAYMAPEQARCEPLDARCDLFSLGVVLYQLCTGEQPFRGSDIVPILMSVVTHDPPPPIKLCTELPPELSDLVMKLLAKDPARRIGTAEEVIQTLDRLEKQLVKRTAIEPSVAVPVPKTSEPPILATTSPTPAASKSRLGPVFVACALLLGLVLLGGGALAYQLFFRTDNGTLVVEVDGDADVRFQQGELRIHDPAGKLLYTLKPSDKNKTLAAGKYLIEVAGVDGLKLDTDKFEIIKNGEAKVRVTLQPPVLAKNGPDKEAGLAVVKKAKVAEKGIRDFAEIHDADEKQFDAWIAQMKKDGFRPVRMTVQTVKESARYTAVALKEEKSPPWEFSRPKEGDNGHVDRQWARKYEAVAIGSYREKGRGREVYLWAKDESLDNEGVWTLAAPFIEEKINAAKKDKKRLISLCAVFVGNEPEFSVIIEETDGVPWQESFNLSLDDLKGYVEKHKADGWRPDHFCYYGVGAKRLFGVILIKDANKTDWGVSWSLTPAEYEKELTVRKGKGFRPLTAAGHEDVAGLQRFSVIWIRYR